MELPRVQDQELAHHMPKHEVPAVDKCVDLPQVQYVDKDAGRCSWLDELDELLLAFPPPLLGELVFEVADLLPALPGPEAPGMRPMPEPSDAVVVRPLLPPAVRHRCRRASGC